MGRRKKNKKKIMIWVISGQIEYLRSDIGKFCFVFFGLVMDNFVFLFKKLNTASPQISFLYKQFNHPNPKKIKIKESSHNLSSRCRSPAQKKKIKQ